MAALASVSSAGRPQDSQCVRLTATGKGRWGGGGRQQEMDRGGVRGGEGGGETARMDRGGMRARGRGVHSKNGQGRDEGGVGGGGG